MDNSTRRQSNRGRRRPVSLVLREEDCDGLITFLETLQYGAESKLMRAILIEWFQEQLATHGADASAAANELIQKYEIIFLQQKHGIQFAKSEAQPKRQAIQASPIRIDAQPEQEVPVSDTTQIAMNAVGVAVESWAAPEAIGETPEPVPAAPMPAIQGGTPPAPANVSGEVDVDNILGL